VHNEDMTEDLIRLRLFFVSYVPLWAMLALRAVPSGGWDWNGRAIAVVLFVAMTVLGLIDAFRLIHGSGETNPRSLYFAQINDQGGNAAGYLATYLLPFIGLVPADWGDWAAYSVYFLVAAIVFIRTDLTFVNPTLYILRYRVISANGYLEVEDCPDKPITGSPFIIVCRDPKVFTGKVDVTSMGGGFVTKNEPKVTRGPRQRNAAGDQEDAK